MAITSFGVFTQATADQITELFNAASANPTLGSRWFVSASGTNANQGTAESPFGTLTYAASVANSGDQIFVGPGSYDEAVAITKSGLTVIGAGNLGAVSFAPSASNAVALTCTGTAALRCQANTFQNIGFEGNGTGGGVKIVGNIRTHRFLSCKIEGGAYAVTLESTAAGSVADTKFLGCEFCWATYGVKLLVSGGGDPVTQTFIQGGLIHNVVTAGVMNVTTHSADVWIDSTLFANQEDGTAPTKYLDIAVASTTGLVSNCTFATTVQAASVLGIASGVIWVNNRTQAEQPGTDAYAASGRPD